MSDLGFNEVKEVFDILNNRIKDNDELKKVLTLIKALNLKQDVIKQRVRGEYKREFEKHIDQSYQRGYNKGREETINRIIDMRQIIHREDFDLFDDWWVIDLRNVLRLKEHYKGLTDLELDKIISKMGVLNK